MSKSNPTISIVDDDVSVRKSLIVLIEQCMNLETASFSSAEEFLEQGSGIDADFLIVDVHLPGISGIKLIEHLTSEGWKGPAVMVTGNADTERLAEIEKISRVHILMKPSNPAQLLSIIGEELSRNTAPQVG